MQNIQDLSIEELNLRRAELMKTISDVIRVSCPIVYLKELCDTINCDVSYRITNVPYNYWCRGKIQYYWIFFVNHQKVLSFIQKEY